jgi:hypothetical protein
LILVKPALGSMEEIEQMAQELFAAIMEAAERHSDAGKQPEA